MFQFLHYLLSLPEGTVATVSTHATDRTAAKVVFGGAPVQAFLFALHNPQYVFQLLH